MKLQALAAIAMIGCTALRVAAMENSPADSPPTAPDKAKLSYAVGMEIGTQLARAGTNVNTAMAIQAVRDVLDGKPAMIQPDDVNSILQKAQTGVTADNRDKFSYAGGVRVATHFKSGGIDLDSAVVAQAIQDELQGKSKMDPKEIRPLFSQAGAYAAVKNGSENEVAGKAFLAKNAAQPGIKTLPDGLQYQIIDPGTGPLATTNDLIFIKYRGTLISGSEFIHHNHFLTRIYGGIQGWKDVLPLMKVGAKWKIFVPPSLAYGEDGLREHGVGPGTTVIFDMELLSIAPPGGSYQVNSAFGKGSDIDADAPSK